MCHVCRLPNDRSTTRRDWLSLAPTLSLPLSPCIPCLRLSLTVEENCTRHNPAKTSRKHDSQTYFFRCGGLFKNRWATYFKSVGLHVTPPTQDLLLGGGEYGVSSTSTDTLWQDV